MNEASNVQTVDDEKAYVEVVVGGGNCEDENPQKEWSRAALAGDKYQHERQEETATTADTNEDGCCLSSPPPPFPSTKSCDLDNRTAAAAAVVIVNKHEDEKKEEDEATNESEEWDPSPPPPLPLEMTEAITAKNKDENEGGKSRDVVQQGERPGAQNNDQHPSPHKITSATTMEAGQWSMHIDGASGRPYFVSHKTGESRWTRPMGPGGVPLPVETSSLGRQQHLFSRVCDKNQAHSESPSFSFAGGYDAGRLGSILDKIDGTAPKRWYKVPDPQGNGEYYADALSGHTQWERPSDYDESLEESAIATAAARVGVIVPTATHATLLPASKYIDYTQTAMFNSRSGRFEGRMEDGDYWQRVGLGPDRETRQMSHYFDVSKLDENRKATMEKKQRLNQRRTGIDWKAFAEKKKKERTKRKNAWLYAKDS